MAELSFKQLIYGGMVAIAGVDGSVTSLETKYVNLVFDKHLKMGAEEKKEVLLKWESKGEAPFTELLIEELLAYPKHNQIEGFSYILKYISWAKKQYNLNPQKESKEFEPIRAELELYHKRAEYIMRSLSFTAKEYATTIRTIQRPKD